MICEIQNQSCVVGWGQLRFRFHWLVTIAAIAAIAALIKLGFWQLSRADEKYDLQQAVNSQQHSTLDISDTFNSGGAIRTIPRPNQLISAEGEFQNDYILFLVFQTYEDQLGYEVLTPLAVPDSKRWLLVSRGWVNPSVVSNPEKLHLLAGKKEIEGHVFIPELNAEQNKLEKIQWPLQIRYQNIQELETILGVPLFPYILRLNEHSPGVLIRHWPFAAPETMVHISYAIQWFAIAIATLILSLLGCSNIVALLRQRLALGEQKLRNL